MAEPPPPSYIDLSDEDELHELPIDADDRAEADDDEDADMPINLDDGEDEELIGDEDDDELDLHDDDEDDDDSDDDDDDDDDYDIDPDYAVYLAQLLSSSLARNGAVAGSDGETESRDAPEEEGGEKRRRIGESETAPSGGAEGSRGNECNRDEIDGIICPICLDAWTNEGEHRICCLPCGHIFGMSCIMRWLLCKNVGKCPQCNQKCKLKDVRKLYGSRVVSVDEETQQRIRALEEKCAFLERKVASCSKTEADWLKREAELQLKVQQLSKHEVLAKNNDNLAGLVNEHPEGIPLEDIQPVADPNIRTPVLVHDLETSSSHASLSTLQQLEDELAAERAARLAIATSRAEVEQRLQSFEESWLQSWHQTMQQIHAFIPGFIIPPAPFIPRAAAQPNQVAGEDEDHASLG